MSLRTFKWTNLLRVEAELSRSDEVSGRRDRLGHISDQTQETCTNRET